MIDIHSHILPAQDDGSDSLDTSIVMLNMAAAAGTTDIVATPHANLEFAFHPDEVNQKIAELQAAVGDTIRVHYGCDFHLTPENIDDALRSPGKYSIDHRGYLLVEFSDAYIPKSTAEIFSAMMDVGIRPIITHPERNQLLQRRIDDLETWVESGCYLQVTAQSILGSFGSRAKDFSHALMNRHIVHFVASDAHDLKHRTTDLQPAWEYVKTHHGADTARLLFIDNPRAVLDGRVLEAGGLASSRRRWFSFFSKRESASPR